MLMLRHLANFRYNLRHKWYVFAECRKLHVPLWIAIWHDWDKFLLDVWLPFVRYIHTSQDAQRPDAKQAFTQAKMTHMHRNKHHWQFWVYIDDCGQFECLPMPDVYRREMLADWRGAGKSMGKPDLLGWYTECRKTMRFHLETQQWLEEQLGYRAMRR